MEKQDKLKLTKKLEEFSREMREVRLNQPWVSAQEAYDQCRRVEKRESLAKDSKKDCDK
jgi:hypothetical protein